MTRRVRESELEAVQRERDDARASLSNCRADLEAEKHWRRKCAEALDEARVERLREALSKIAESHDAGRHDGLPEECPAHDQYEMWAVAREALNEYADQIRRGEDER